MRIAHVTSAHPRSDVRIALKMCRSLTDAGHDVTLVVADGNGDESSERWDVVDVGRFRNRLSRASLAAKRVASRALALRPDIVHVHDPELLPAFAAARRPSGTRIVFDAHENVPDQILGKHYLPRWSRSTMSRGYTLVERILARRVDAIVTATPTIEDRYRRFHNDVECIANFPLVDEFHGAAVHRTPENAVCYVGVLAPTRGIGQMVEAVALARSGVRLKLGGRFSRDRDRIDVSRSRGWELVDELGYLDRDGVRAVLATSLAGLVTLQPTPAYVDAYPIKLFEYMSASLPIIASDFPIWRQIVDTAGCGVLVDPNDPASIAQAIDTLVENPEAAAQMGRNGRSAIETTYNWEAEAKKLFALYYRLMGD